MQHFGGGRHGRSPDLVAASADRCGMHGTLKEAARIAM
jgi:hypothetical protein